jgi:hypothetical protein
LTEPGGEGNEEVLIDGYEDKLNYRETGISTEM